MSGPKPFHESVVDKIFCCSNTRLEFLASLITATKIPKNHDCIIAAWNARAEEMGWGDKDQYGVIAHVLAQKEENERRTLIQEKSSMPVEVAI